jgi:hypothetical protein
VPCFAVQYSTSPQKRSKEGGRALSDEAPLGMSMEMLTFGTNLGGYRTDITEQQIRGAPAFSRDQTSANRRAVFDTRSTQIIALAAKHRLPAMYQFRQYAVTGGLISYGPSITDSYKQAIPNAMQLLADEVVE